MKFCWYIYIPGRGRLRGPFVAVLQGQGKVMKKIVITPIKNGTFLDSKPATIAFISFWGVCILLLHLHRQVKELAPSFPSHVHQLRTHPMVHDLEEAPLITGLGDLAQSGGPGFGLTIKPSKVDNWDVGIIVENSRRWTVTDGLDISIRDWIRAPFGQGLNPDYWLGPILRATGFRHFCYNKKVYLWILWNIIRWTYIYTCEEVIWNKKCWFRCNSWGTWFVRRRKRWAQVVNETWNSWGFDRCECLIR